MPEEIATHPECGDPPTDPVDLGIGEWARKRRQRYTSRRFHGDATASLLCPQCFNERPEPHDQEEPTSATPEQRQIADQRHDPEQQHGEDQYAEATTGRTSVHIKISHVTPHLPINARRKTA